MVIQFLTIMALSAFAQNLPFCTTAETEDLVGDMQLYSTGTAYTLALEPKDARANDGLKLEVEIGSANQKILLWVSL